LRGCIQLTPNELPALLRVKRRLFSLIAEPLAQGPLSHTLESTATYHYPLMRCWGGRPCIVNPALAASFKARKTDRIDAYKLALHHLQGLWPPSFVPTAETEVLRLFTRSRARMLRGRTRLYNSINTRLWQWNCPPTPRGSRDRLIRAEIEDLARGAYQAGDPQFSQAGSVPLDVWEWCVHLVGAPGLPGIRAELLLRREPVCA
jgi:transposase